MEIIILPTADAASRLAARDVAAILRRLPHPVLGLATGSTPLGLYQELIRLHREEGLTFGHATSFNLDEYVGLPAGHPASYASFMEENFFRHIDLPRHFLPVASSGDVTGVCEAYEAAITASGGIDVQVLGIGRDGHIGFNEPSSSLRSRTRLKTLTPQTREDNARFFAPGEEVPIHVVTMGIASIMDAREIVFLAFGENKAAAVAATVEGPVSASCPASVLQFHPKARLYLDEEAASRLQRTDYYRWVYEHKPVWQRP